LISSLINEPYAKKEIATIAVFILQGKRKKSILLKINPVVVIVPKIINNNSGDKSFRKKYIISTTNKHVKNQSEILKINQLFPPFEYNIPKSGLITDNSIIESSPNFLPNSNQNK